MIPTSLEDFARIRHLSPTWIDLRRQCNRIVEQSDFWYRKDLQDRARELAVKASDILTAITKVEGRK